MKNGESYGSPFFIWMGRLLNVMVRLNGVVDQIWIANFKTLSRYVILHNVNYANFTIPANTQKCSIRQHFQPSVPIPLSSQPNSKKIMRYPNTRYGNPTEFRYYAQGQKPKEIAKRLRRSEHSVTQWLAGKRRMPWWIPEILRLQRLEYDLWMHQSGLGRMRTKLGVASADVIAFKDIRQPDDLPAPTQTGQGNSQAA